MDLLPEPKARLLSVGGTQVRYLDSEVGGLTILLVHGGSCDSADLSWGRVLPLLGQDYRLVAPDLPGFGKSDMPAGACSAQFLIQFLADFVRELNLSPVVLTGLSMGGLVSAGLVLQDASVARGLVLVASAGLQKRLRWARTARLVSRLPRLHSITSRLLASTDWSLERALRLFLCSQERVEPELLQQVKEALTAPGAGQGWRSFLSCEMDRDGFRTSHEASLAEIRVPVLLMHGKKDRLVPYEDSVSASRLIPGAELELLEDCGHWLPRDRPGEFCESLRSFISRRIS